MSDPFSLASDYERVASAIAFMQSHSPQQLDLAAMAGHVQFSEEYCQQLFTRWAGVSPQHFMPLLTVASTKQRLLNTQSWLAAILDADSLSPHRPQGSYVRLEAMTPADYRSGGSGMEIAYGLHATRFGPALIAQTAQGICNLQFCASDHLIQAVGQLQQQWPQAKFTQHPELTQSVADRLNQALMTESPQPPLTVLVKGTNFQIQVWRALLTLPLGSLLTYQDIANRIAKPKAARAVGTAIGANPVGYLIPCHRVIRATGEIGGYRWGPLRKTVMLGWEAAQCQEEV
ncbi:methylated-DNA--[protein]-cysteine S-methyltransferase [Halomicronema sp. CCY15110]|uniref:methylated-DNA--[protein]-cysteine S-methyltransferase n=1 Tax=Halomicronema sp. CCY15110 TaxID=2767773 RepID=UPI001951C215|nr:methylated-DNA--[protein]-cysteine S-methyltransferase [Halomicronema sp. CCY15110]